VFGDHEEGAHGMEVVQRRGHLGHLDRCDAERPHVAPRVVGNVRVFRGNNLGSHPIYRSRIMLLGTSGFFPPTSRGCR